MVQIKLDPTRAPQTNYGAANTNPLGLSQGALAALGGSGNVQAAVELAKALQPKEEKFDPAMAALLYFTEMGKNASEPGATLLGSASGAFSSPAAYLMQQRKDEKDRKSKLAPLAVQLATTFKDADDKKGNVASKAYTNTNTGEVEHYTPKQFNTLQSTNHLVPYSKPTIPVPKTSSKGGTAIYFGDTESAKKFVEGMGLTNDNPNFNRLVERLVTSDPDRIGQAVIGPGGLAMEILPTYRGSTLTNMVFSSIPGTQSAEYQLKLKRLAILAKEKTAVLGKGFNVLPSIDTALEVILSGVQTGGLEEATLDIRNKLIGVFGLDAKEVEGQQMLESISNKLAPGMRPVGSGSTSDMEFKAFKSAVLTMSNTPFANYMSLWTLKRVTENAARASALEEELLSSNKNYSQKYVNEQIEEIDTGLYSKFKTKDEDGKPLYENDDEKAAAATRFYNNLPRGDVFYNLDEDGKPIFIKKAGVQNTFLIKGFPKMKGAN